MLPGRDNGWYRWTGVAGMLYASTVIGLDRVVVRGRGERARETAIAAIDRAARRAAA